MVIPILFTPKYPPPPRSSREKPYSAYRRPEFLALKWAVFPAWSVTSLQTCSSSPPTYLITSVKWSPRDHQYWWLAAFAQFDFNNTYFWGSANGEADGLLRMPHDSLCSPKYIWTARENAEIGQEPHSSTGCSSKKRTKQDPGSHNSHMEDKDKFSYEPVSIISNTMS